MAAATDAGPGQAAPAAPAGPNHGLRIFLLWLPLAVIADLVIWFVWGPHLPPGAMSSTASGQQFDIKVLARAGRPGDGLRARLLRLRPDRLAAARR